MRTTYNLLTPSGNLYTGYDYENHAWVVCGEYVRCGHPEEQDCGCFGREHEGEPCDVRGDGEK